MGQGIPPKSPGIQETYDASIQIGCKNRKYQWQDRCNHGRLEHSNRNETDDPGTYGQQRLQNSS